MGKRLYFQLLACAARVHWVRGVCARLFKKAEGAEAVWAERGMGVWPSATARATAAAESRRASTWGAAGDCSDDRWWWLRGVSGLAGGWVAGVGDKE